METYLITNPGATDAVNKMSVTKYPDRETAEAAKRPDQTLVQTEADVPWTGASLVAAYNGVTGLGVTRFESSDVGKRRLVTQLPRYAVDPPGAAREEKSTMSDEKKTRGRAPSYKDADVIRVATEGGKNPKREGSNAHKRFALYRDGMTVGEFVAAGGVRTKLPIDVGYDQIRIEKAA